MILIFDLFMKKMDADFVGQIEEVTSHYYLGILKNLGPLVNNPDDIRETKKYLKSNFPRMENSRSSHQDFVPLCVCF